MLTKEDVQVVLFKQDAFGANPGTPNGILVPRGASSDVQHKRNVIDNPQVQADGFEREFALGNHLVELSGNIVPNLNVWPWFQRWLCGELVTTGAGPYTHTSVLKKTPVFHALEVGIPLVPLYYIYRDLLISRLSLDIPIEGIWTADLTGAGSGDVDFAETTPLDATVTEVSGTPGEYANMTITKAAADPGFITRLRIDIDRTIVEKRAHGDSGRASEMKYGESRVSGEVDTYFETDAEYAKARAGTIEAIVATLASGADSLAITMPEVKLEPVGPSIQGDDGIMQTFRFRSIKKVSADAPIKFVTTNTNAGTVYA